MGEDNLVAVLTVEDVLSMAPLRASGPAVVAGRGGLRRSVRWVHSTELADIAPLLREGDLLLSTGIALPGTDADLARFASSLGESEAAGLVIELGRRWNVLPPALISACEGLDLPLIALGSEVRFAAVAQAVGERIVDEQLEELKEAQRVHETFTELSIAEARPHEVLEAAQRLAGTTVVLESEDHQVIDYRPGPTNIDAFLAAWPTRSRTVRLAGNRTTWSQEQGWLVTRLGRRGRAWGRFVVESSHEPSQRLVAIAERAAAALALHRLHDRHRDSLVRRTHHELVVSLMTDPTDPDVVRRCEVAGLPTNHRQLVGLTIRPVQDITEPAPGAAALLDDLIASTVRAAHDVKAPALVCEIDRTVRVLLSMTKSASAHRVVDDLAERIRRRHSVVVGAGRPAGTFAEADRTLRESEHVVAAVRDPITGPDVRRLENVHLLGLLALLGDDERVTMFIERELGLLRTHDEAHGTYLLETVRALVEHPSNKSEAAASLHVSRPVFYDRLNKVERLLAVSLDDPDVRVSLHVALLAAGRAHGV